MISACFPTEIGINVITVDENDSENYYMSNTDNDKIASETISSVPLVVK